MHSDGNHDDKVQNIDNTALTYTLNISTGVGLVACAIFVVYGINHHIFTSQDALSEFLIQLGIAAPMIFILIQAIQVIIPIIPGSIGCLGGVIFFGPFWGFLFNYVGICTGSIIAFLLARRYGQPIVRSMASKKKWEKYSSWLNTGKKYERLFALAIIFPVAPDDFLCYLSGLTDMKLSKFTFILLICKPFSIAIYTFLLTFLYNILLGALG